MPTASELLLVPRPQRLTRTGPGAPVTTPVRARRAPGLRPEGFRLAITPDAVALDHADDAGRRHGEALLRQLRDQADPDGRLPGVQVEDWPDLPVRGFMLDISRDRVPTRATLERLVGLLALARYNQLQLYMEHTFAYAAHEAVWRHASPLTPDDVRWLDDRCRAHGIELVPNQNCFGHMGRWLAHPDHRHRAETPDGFELLPGLRRPPGVLAPTPENARFALDLFDELLPNFTSRRVHIGGDETFELGLGASRAEVAARGKEAVYLEHVLRIAGPLLDRGYEVLLWADVLRAHPGLLRRLPAGVVPVTWTYEAPHPAAADGGTAGGDGGRIPDDIRELLARIGIDPDAHRGFAANTGPLAEAGVPFWVAPGTSTWLSLVGRLDNALANIVDAAHVAADRGAPGLLLTNWGDEGHMEPPAVSFAPLVHGGAVSWSRAANHDLDLAAVLDRYVLGDATGTLGAVLADLGRAWRRTGQRAFNGSALMAGLCPDVGMLVGGRPDPERLVPLVADLDAAIDAVGRSQPSCPDAELVRAELTTVARLARHGAYRLLRAAGVDGGPVPDRDGLRSDLLEGIEAYQRDWRARSREGGLRDSVAHLQATLATYDE
ncbi:MAG TPA: family 20 glycosylhydrolase [Acidimicrobiales bacterium]